KARQANQIIATSGASLDHLTAAERAWTNVVEGYKMAVEKAMKAKLKCVELADAFNNAVSTHERVAIAQREYQKKIKKEEADRLEAERIKATEEKIAFANEIAQALIDTKKEAEAAALIASESLSKALRKAKEEPGSKESEAAWREALEQTQQTKQAWEKIFNVYQTAITISTEENIFQTNCLKKEWKSEFCNVENEKNRWEARIGWREVNQKEDELIALVDRASKIQEGSEDSVIAWENALKLGEQAKEAIEQTVKAYEINTNKAEKKYQADWEQAWEKAKKNKNRLTIQVQEITDRKNIAKKEVERKEAEKAKAREAERTAKQDRENNIVKVKIAEEQARIERGKAECESLQREARTKTLEATESARRARAEAQQSYERAEATHAEEKKCWLSSSKDAKKYQADELERSVTVKRAEAKSWDKASGYWDKAIELLAQGNSERAHFWIMKANITGNVAEVKFLAAKVCDRNWMIHRDRPHEIITLIRNKVWPIVVQAMKDFTEYPSETRMRNTSVLSSTAASACVYCPGFANCFSAFISASAFVCTSAYTSACISAYAYADFQLSLAVFASDSPIAMNMAEFFATGSVSDDVPVILSCYASQYASVAVSVSTYISAFTISKIFAESATEAADSIKIFGIVEARSMSVFELSKKHPNWFTAAARENIIWSVQSVRETADFARAVVEFKRKQEALIVVSDRRREIENIRERDRRVEQEKLAEVKVLAESACADDSKAKIDRMNAIIKRTREKFGSPVSQVMKNFIEHPNEATLRAIGKSFVISMNADEAEEYLEIAEVFFKQCANEEVALVSKKNIDVALRENIDWAATITPDITEFARAIVNFKRAQEAAKQPQL
ncbi:MAG TPA: hypothetical protein VJK54_03560, partial [Chthoniobacterales bacterium]|nr:hypothetical protein [Chthoniobacterales bacterium]